MRIQKFAGLAAGALIAGLTTTPLLAGTAHAAEEGEGAPVVCTYNDWSLDYDPTITAAGVDGKVELSMSSFPGIAGVPAFVTVKNVAAEAAASYGGEDITLSGSQAVSPSTPLANGFNVPTLSADRPEGVDGGQMTLTGLKFDLVANAFGSDTDAAIPCVLTEPIVVDVAAEPAPPAPVVCTYNDWSLDYDPTITAAGVDGKVELSMSSFPGIAGVPAFVTVKNVAAEAAASYGGEDITLSGSQAVSPSTPLANGFNVPTLSADRPEGVDGGQMTLTGLKFDLVANAFGSDTDAAIPCVLTEPIVVDVAAEPAPPAPVVCTYNDWSLDYDPTITAAGVDGKVELSMSSFPGIAGVPAFVTVKNVAAEAAASYGGEDITLSGSQAVSPSTPLANGFNVPTLSADRPEGVDGGQMTLTGLKFDLVANAFGSDTDAAIPCVLTEPIVVDVAAEPVEETPEVVATTTAVEATSPAPNTVALSVTVTPADAEGIVEIYQGGTKVGEVAVSNGTASHSMTGVAAGEHTFTAKFVPADAEAFEVSESTGSTVTVEDAPVVEQPVAKAKPKLQKVKANFKKKKKVLTVKAQVKGPNGKATGKVKITIKKGKKTVRTITVKLNKKGAFTKKIKKIKGKGKFKVVIQYQGDQNYKKAKATKQFRA